MKALNLFYYLLASTLFLGLCSFSKDKESAFVASPFSLVDVTIKNNSSYIVAVTFRDAATRYIVGSCNLGSGSLATVRDVFLPGRSYSYSVVCKYNFFSDISGGTQISGVSFTDDRTVFHKVTDFGYRTVDGERMYLYSGSLSLDGDYPYNDINCVIR
jgi:hypothetical protein